jgi:hypothetical protein
VRYDRLLNHLPRELRQAAQGEIAAKLATPECIRLDSIRLIALASKPGAA